MDFFRITCFKEHKNMTVEMNLKMTINFYKRQCFPVITWNKKHLLKQVVPMTYTLEKRFFAAVILLTICESFLFRESKKNVVYFSLYESSLNFQRREDQINTV